MFVYVDYVYQYITHWEMFKVFSLKTTHSLKVNINNILLWRRYFKTKNTMRSVTLLYILPLALMHCLKWDMDFQYCFYIQSIVYVVCLKYIKKTPALHRYIVEKGCMEYFSVFSCNCDRFLKISCSVNFETISVKLLCSVTLKMYWIFDVYATL